MSLGGMNGAMMEILGSSESGTSNSEEAAVTSIPAPLLRDCRHIGLLRDSSISTLACASTARARWWSGLLFPMLVIPPHYCVFVGAWSTVLVLAVRGPAHRNPGIALGSEDEVFAHNDAIAVVDVQCPFMAQ